MVEYYGLRPTLEEGEEILILQDDTCTTVREGPGGFLHFRLWAVENRTFMDQTWKLDGEFVLGSEGVGALQVWLNTRRPA